MVGETHNAPKNTRAEEGQPATIRLSVSRSTDQLLIINLPPPPNDVRRDAALKLKLEKTIPNVRRNSDAISSDCTCCSNRCSKEP